MLLNPPPFMKQGLFAVNQVSLTEFSILLSSQDFHVGVHIFYILTGMS